MYFNNNIKLSKIQVKFNDCPAVDKEKATTRCLKLALKIAIMKAQ